MDNKKVKNAVATTYNSIDFKSRLEVSCYKKLETSGLSFSYEADCIILWEGKRVDNVIVYDLKNKRDKFLTQRKIGYKLQDMSYTPDFRVNYKDYEIYFDVKGHVNDVYPLKKKIFIQHLNNKSLNKKKKYMFFEPHTVKQMVQAIEIIKNL